MLPSLKKFTRSMRFSGTRDVHRPNYDVNVGTVAAVSYLAPNGQTQWYPPVMVGVDFVAGRLRDAKYIDAAISLMETLTPDDYTSFVVEFYRDGRRRFGAGWKYADIVTVLLCLAEHLKVQTYLEIGVRRGRSVAAVASMSPRCALTMFDMWMPNYAGMENPGPALVRQELARVGHSGPTTFIDGDSHMTVPAYFQANPTATFDLITVDGDHSEQGATLDLCNVLPRLNVGGAIVFDDICHPLHPELAGVWNNLVTSDSRFSSFMYSDAGYGVGFAIRKH